MEQQLLKPAREDPSHRAPIKKGKKIFFRGNGITISLVALVLLAASSVYLWKDSIKIGAEALMSNYRAAFESEKDAAYKELYQSAFKRAEQQYHVSNTVVISIGNLEETNKLEVLKATDVEFITEDRDSNSGNVTAWLEVSGEGTFVVDLRAAEFIIDNEHRHVLVRVPNPELTDITITDTQKRWFKDDWDIIHLEANGSYREGVDLALKQRNEASLQIQKSLISNQYIYGNAQTIAKSMIANLVRQFNPDIPDLVVDIEFMP